MCYTESSHEICQVFPRKCVLLETWADLISFSQSLWPSGGGRWRLLGVWRKSDQLTGVVPRNPGNHSTYPPKKKTWDVKNTSHIISSTLKTGKVQLHLARFLERAWNPGMIPWFDVKVAAIQLSKWPDPTTWISLCPQPKVHFPCG